MAPNNRGWHEISVSIAMVVLASIAITLRFVARFRRRLALEIDDWLALTGLVSDSIRTHVESMANAEAVFRFWFLGCL